MNQKEIKLSVGEWKTRGGEKALVEYEHKGLTYPWRGYVGGVPHAWIDSGHYYSSTTENDKDIVGPWTSSIAPKKRLIRVEELPPVCWVKDPSSDSVWMIHGRSEDSCRIYIGGMTKRIRELKDDWQWSTDLKTWNSFEVEDK